MTLFQLTDTQQCVVNNSIDIFGTKGNISTENEGKHLTYIILWRAGKISSQQILVRQDVHQGKKIHYY